MGSRADYDDPNYSYVAYWQGRDYEHASEISALKKLLGNSKFEHGVDVGGGFGRVTAYLGQFCDQVDLVEPAEKQRTIAKKFLAEHPLNKNKDMTCLPADIEIKNGTADKIPLPDKSADLLIMVRVMHHIPEPSAAFAEIARVLKPGGTLILECANSAHFKARVKSIINRQMISADPVERRSLSNIEKETIAFVNHNPKTVIKQLKEKHLTVRNKLSVSNLRQPIIKKVLPSFIINSAESALQFLLAPIYFGPSIWFLAKKNS